MSNSFRNEIPKARINLKLDLHTGGASKKTELPLKLLVAGDFSNGKENASISEHSKININKNNINSVLADYSPDARFSVKNTLTGMLPNDIPKTFTIELGCYGGLEPARPQQGNRCVKYKFD